MKKMTHWTPDKIRELRGRFAETQKEFVERLGVDVWTLRYWEQGRGLPGGSSRILLDRLEQDISASEAANGNGHEKAKVAV